MVVLGGGAVSYERGTPVRSLRLSNIRRGYEPLIDSGLVGRKAGEVPRGKNMLYSGTDPESYITEYTLVYED